jgi:phage-related minor tail protein
MDEDTDPVMVRIVADTADFRREMEELRGTISGRLAEGASSAGRSIESALARAARTGKLEFEDLARVAAKVLGDLAGAALSGGAGGAAGAVSGGLGGVVSGLLGGLFGLPGRATGGPVSPGQAYVVGERGPELFVPTSSGRVEVGSGGARGPVTVNVHVAVPSSGGGDFMARTANQVARAVRRTLEREEG